jgi:hypothetical protein
MTALASPASLPANRLEWAAHLKTEKRRFTTRP